MSVVPGVPGLRTITPTEALRRPRRLDLRILAGLGLMVASGLAILVLWSAAQTTRGVVVVTRSLPAGARLEANDLAVVQAQLPNAVYRAAVPASERATLVGRQLAQPVYAQQVLARGLLAGQPLLSGEQRAVTIPVSSDRAVGGQLQPGDLVDVVVAVKGTTEVTTEEVLSGVTVYDVDYDRQVVVTASTAPATEAARPRRALASVTLAATREQAKALLAAKQKGELNLLLVPPEAALAGSQGPPGGHGGPGAAAPGAGNAGGAR